MSRATGSYAIICHDDRAMVSGDLLDADDTGCEVRSTDRSLMPVFKMSAPVVLNLLDERRNASVNIIARAVDARRENEGWVYSFSWKRKPAFLSTRRSKQT